MHSSDSTIWNFQNYKGIVLVLTLQKLNFSVEEDSRNSQSVKDGLFMLG